jgi:hypothetical protein
MINQSQVSGWGRDSPNPLPPGTVPRLKAVVIKLPVAVNIGELQINPANTCGDSGSASTGDYKVETSVDGVTWVLAKQGRFGIADRPMNTIPMAHQPRHLSATVPPTLPPRPRQTAAARPREASPTPTLSTAPTTVASFHNRGGPGAQPPTRAHSASPRHRQGHHPHRTVDHQIHADLGYVIRTCGTLTANALYAA